MIYRISLSFLALAFLIFALSLEGSLRLDTAEGAIAGVAWVMAHPKHPPLPFWLIEIARPSYFWLYAISYGSIALGIAIMARFSRLTAAFCLAFPLIIYAPVQMNHNIILYPLVCATLYTLWLSLNRGFWRDWLLFGVVVGMSFYAKYAIVLLLAPFALAMVFHKEWRKHLFTLKPWAAVMIALLIMMPHLIALKELREIVQNPLRLGDVTLLSTLKSTAGWIFNYTALILPLAFLYKTYPRKPRNNFELFANVAAFGAPLIVFTSALIFGVRPRPYWLLVMTPGIALYLSMLSPKALPNKALIYSFAILCIWVIFKITSPLFSSKPHYADFDARKTAEVIENYYGEKPKMIISFGAQRGRQLAGSLLYEISPVPHVLEEGEQALSPWIKKVDKALIVSTLPLDTKKVMGKPITDIKVLDRPITNRPFASRLETTKIWVGRVN